MQIADRSMVDRFKPGKRGRILLLWLGFVCFLGTSILHGQESEDVIFVLLPSTPFDPLHSQLKAHLRQNASSQSDSKFLSAESLLETFGSDPGAWKQARGFVRASMWFTLGRQGIFAQDDSGTLRAFQQTRTVLEDSGLMARGPLLASMALLSGRVQLNLGDAEAAMESFRTAALIDPNDGSQYLPEGEGRTLYRESRRQIQQAPRLPIKVEVSGDGREGAALFVNGTPVSSAGPLWVIDLPPGRHYVAASRAGYRPDSRGVSAIPGQPRPELQLRLEPGQGMILAMKPFALAEVMELLSRCQALLAQERAQHLILGVVAGPLEGQSDGSSGPRVGVQVGVRVNPGPDTGETDAGVTPVRVEMFDIDTRGFVKFLGGSIVSPSH